MRVPSALISTFRNMLLNELTDGMEVDQVLLVREAERRQRRDGGEYLRLQLGDRTGAVACMVWEELGEVEELVRAGEPVRVLGRYTIHPRFGPQINLRGLEAPEPGSFSPEDLSDGPARGVEQMEGEIRELLGTIQEPHLRSLLDRVFGEESTMWAGYRVAPAAKYYHQAYRHGLLEHSPRGSPGRERDQRDVPGYRPGRGGDRARCCTTSASSRPTPRTPRASTSPTPVGCTGRSRSATTASDG